MIRIIAILLFVGFIGITESTAQIEVDDNSSFLDRIYTGGGLALSVGNNVTVIGASPVLGYMITDKWAAGVGITYLYRKFGNFKSNIYGGKVFTQYNVAGPVFLYSEYEVLSYDFTLTDGVNNRESVPAFNVGGGIIQPISKNASFQFMFLYDLVYDNLRSPNPEPWSVRGGIAIGF
ncbi:MAG: hypothetical protein RJQ09_01760 [Cyclobacteriaceae bacterium]